MVTRTLPHAAAKSWDPRDPPFTSCARIHMTYMPWLRKGGNWSAGYLLTLLYLSENVKTASEGFFVSLLTRAVSRCVYPSRWLVAVTYNLSYEPID